MSETKRVSVHSKIFRENPYDLETFFETLSIASKHDKEIIYIDRFISKLRSNPEIDLTLLNYQILEELNIMK